VAARDRARADRRLLLHHDVARALLARLMLRSSGGG
jgi:hypothetical protein